MLKGFVSGEEKDIKRVTMKGKQLWDGVAIRGYIDSSGSPFKTNGGTSAVIECKPNTTYTVNRSSVTETNRFMISTSDTYPASGTSLTKIIPNSTTIYDYTFTTNSTALYIIVYLHATPNSDISGLMVSEGSTPLPYEPYGYQEGWEVRDNQDRLIWGREDELQTATGTLPFKGYGLPVKVKSLLGNAVQNGTPSPSPVNLNLVDPSATVPGYQESNGNIHEPSSGNERTTDWIPFTTDALYAIVSGSNSGNINWVLYDSSKQPLYFYGPTFSPNTVIIISRSGYSTAAFIRISWTNAANQPICVTTERRSEYIAFDPNPPGPVVPEMCGVRTGNLFDVHKEWVKSSNTDTVIVSGNSVTITSKYYAKVKIPVPKNTDCVIKANVFEEGETTTGTAAIYESDSSTRIIYSVISEIKDVPFNTGNNDEIWVYLYASNGTEKTKTYSEIMLNLGSTALPYEPYGWKISFENHGENLCNVSSGNTLTYASSYNNFLIDDNTRTITITGNVLVGFPVPVEPNTTYTVYASSTKYGLIRVREYSDKPSEWVGTEFIQQTINERCGYAYNFTTTAQTKWIVVAFYFDEDQSGAVVSNIMLTPGTTPKPYSPYLNETLPVHLGEVPTVRRIKKLVLDGTEDWMQYTNYSAQNCYKLTVRGMISGAAICTHYANTTILRTLIDNDDTHLAASNTWIIHDSQFATIEDIKRWLQDEYAAGHPVTIWYVLANEQTGISNEPLCKISTYADELTTIQVHGLSAPLYGIGDYKDTLNLSTGVVTRKVKRLVLDGTESYSKQGTSSTLSLYSITVSQNAVGRDKVICSHLPLSLSYSSGISICFYSDLRNLFLNFGLDVMNAQPSGNTVNGLKEYLAQQYQNGTPVTVWYVLETPETETVTVPTGMTGEIEGYLTQVSTPTPTNRSVPKWNGVEETGGTYAVTVYTPPEIPTTTGENTLTVETEKIHGLTNPLCGIGDYKDVLNLSTGVITRKVKKLVLTGEEDITSSHTDIGLFNIAVTDYLKTLNVTSVCSHYPAGKNVNGWTEVTDLTCRFYAYKPVQSYTLYIRDSSFTTLNDFKAYLASEYAAGHPVTVWYVLSTPETETITVPYGLECSVEGYLTQSDTPTPSSPITPDSNGILESGGTYAVEVSLVPSNLTVKGHIKELT